MKKITQYKNIVFDMGGVLLDDTADNATRHFTDDPEIIREIHNVMFYSQEWLALKPQPIIYRIFFERFGLNPSECFFIDDLSENVEASIKCGMDAWCFSTGNNEDLKKVLEL